MIRNNLSIFWLIEVYPEKMDGTHHIMRYKHDVVYC